MNLTQAKEIFRSGFLLFPSACPVWWSVVVVPLWTQNCSAGVQK